MTSSQIEIQLIAIVVGAACALPGVFLVLRKMSLISDAISHSILPGIVLGFFITEDLNAPLNILLAAATGILTVVLVEFIQKTGLVKEDTAIGLVFPAMFSVGVILIALNANDVHLDIDAVLVGELAFAPFDRLIINSVDIGPKALWVMGVILLISITLLIVFFKELKISTFDEGLATALGFSPIVLHYGLMSVASITTVGAFDAVGAILVVALMIAPAATVYLLTDDLKKMLLGAVTVAVFSAITGYWFAHWIDASIAGAITSVLGFVFFITYLFAPKRGILSVLYRKRQQRKEVMLLTFLLHIQNHEEERERHVNHLNEHINWHEIKAKSVLDLALKNNLIIISNKIINLTPKGFDFSKQAIQYITDNERTGIEHMKEELFLFRG